MDLNSDQLPNTVAGAFFAAFGVYMMVASLSADLRPKTKWKNDKAPPPDDVSPDIVRRIEERNRVPAVVCFVIGLVFTIWGSVFMYMQQIEDAGLKNLAFVILFCANGFSIVGLMFYAQRQKAAQLEQQSNDDSISPKDDIGRG